MQRSHCAEYVHIVFSTKNRQPVLFGESRAQCHRYIAGIARNLKCKPFAVGGTADHVHALLYHHPDVATRDLVKRLKSNSSRFLHESFRDQRGFAWQARYGSFSVSPRDIVKVVQYIRNQERHHRSVSLFEEIRHLTKIAPMP